MNVQNDYTYSFSLSSTSALDVVLYDGFAVVNTPKKKNKTKNSPALRNQAKRGFPCETKIKGCFATSNPFNLYVSAQHVGIGIGGFA